ncbi:MAG: PilZ domain-containing protein [Candidatus Dadabacteria bacterium]|nr:MAG: PilZ domain-containing protein [Candidatus Dadabacteria bacterium]
MVINRLPEWINEARQAPRWRDVRTVGARAESGENLGKTLDVSLGGAGVRFAQAPVPRPGEVWRFDIVFEREVRTFAGRVVYARPDGRVGVRWVNLSPRDRAFLARRYASGTRGRVT